MSVPVRKPCNACVASYWLKDASRFSLYRFDVFSHLVSAASHAATLAFHFKIIAFNEIFPTLSAAKLSPCARFFFAMDIKLCSIHGLARKTFYALAILDPIYKIIFQLKAPSAPIKTSEKRFETRKLVCHCLVMLNIRPRSQEACTLNNDCGMKFSS